MSSQRVYLGIFFVTPFLFLSWCSSLPQHEEGMGLIEDNEINNNTLAGVWITTGKYPGHVTTINYLHFLNGNFNKVITSGAAVGFFKGGGWVTLCQSEGYSPDCHALFATCGRLFVKKRLTKGWARSPQDPLATPLHCSRWDTLSEVILGCPNTSPELLTYVHICTCTVITWM